MNKILPVLFALAFASPAVAQHAHSSKGPNGGAMQDIAGVHAELMTSGNTLTFNIVDEASKPISTTGFVGSALVASGGDREMITLSPSGSALKGDAKKPLAAGVAISLTIKTAAGKSGQAKFKN